MDVFFILKLAVLVALAVAFALSIALVVQRAKNRSEISEILPAVEEPINDSEPVDDSEPVISAVPVEESCGVETGREPSLEVPIELAMEENESDAQAIESLDFVDGYSHDNPDSERHSMSKPEMLRKPSTSFSEQPLTSQKNVSSDFLQTLLSINAESELYCRSKGLLTTTEQAVLRDLRNAGGKSVEVFCKVPVLDVLSSKEESHFHPSQEVINILSTQYFSFVVCLRGSLDVIGAVEAFDRQGKFLDMHKGRLRVLKTISRKAGVPMTILDTASGYSSSQLKHQVSSLITHAHQPFDTRVDASGYAFLTNANTRKKSAVTTQPAAVQTSCPRCGDGMVYRVSRSGKYKGQVFHTCQSYPTCRHIVREPGAAHASTWSGIKHKQPA